MSGKVFVKNIYFLLLLFSLGSFAQDISGVWNWEYQDKNQTTISLENIGNDTYIGNYCSVFYSGKKIDCSDDAELCISLKKVSNNIFEGVFESTSFYGKGSLRLIYSSSKPDKIKLKILSKSGEFYLPNDVYFSR